MSERRSLLPELRAALEWAWLRLSPVYYGAGVLRGDGAPVVLIPGALASDCSLLEMRLWLGRLGYRVYTSGIGRMVDCPDVMRDKLLETIDLAHQDTGRPVTLVGHSLGGMIARGAALKRPDEVASVIMLASPFRRLDAHPLVMRLIGLVHGRKLQRHLRRTENSCIKCFVDVMAEPLPQRVSSAAIYTRTDPVVDWHDCVEEDESLNYEVSGTHVGLVVNSRVYQLVAGLLANRRAGFRETLPMREARRMRLTWGTEDRRIPCQGCCELYEPGLRWTSGYCRGCHQARRAMREPRCGGSSAKLINAHRRSLGAD